MSTCESNNIVSGSYADNTLSLVRQGGGSVDIPFEGINTVTLYKTGYTASYGQLASLRSTGTREVTELTGEDVQLVSVESVRNESIFEGLGIDTEYSCDYTDAPPFSYTRVSTYSCYNQTGVRTVQPKYKITGGDDFNAAANGLSYPIVSCMTISDSECIESYVNYEVTNCYIIGWSSSTSVMMGEPAANDNGNVILKHIDGEMSIDNFPTEYYCNRRYGDIVLDIYPSPRSEYSLL